MGWLDSILDKGTEAGVKNHARGTCKAMVASAQLFTEDSDPECSSSGGVARLALEGRPGWRRVPGTNEFIYKGRFNLRVPDAWRITKAATEVATIEVADIVSELPSPKPTMLIAEAILACKQYFDENPTR